MRPLISALLLSGCFVFDASLYMDAGADGGGTAISDTCETTAPMLEVAPGTSVTFPVDTMARRDDARDTVACTGRMENGPDVFVQIDPELGDRWHFHVRVETGVGGANPAIYVLSSCDPRECQGGDGIDTCGAGADEHFTFVPDVAATYQLAFDSVDGEGFRGNVEAYRNVCGDATQSHGESCDDGNADDTVCDSLCRVVLTGASPLEDEVNDDIHLANFLSLAPGSSMAVRGEIANLCEIDVYALEVPEGASIVAALSAEGGAACGASADGTELELIELSSANNPRVRVAGTGDPCPSIDAAQTLARNLPAGTYYLHVRNVIEGTRATAFRYQLDVTLEAP